MPAIIYTLKNPLKLKTIGGRGRLNACIGCRLCSRDCHTKTIEMRKVFGKKRPQVNLLKCVFCYHCAEICLKKAINYSCQYEIATTDKSTLVVKPKEWADP